MGDGRFPFEAVSGVPVVAAPDEIDITSAPGAAVGPAGGSRAPARDARGGHDLDPVL
jgi:hypothetical protein